MLAVVPYIEHTYKEQGARMSPYYTEIPDFYRCQLCKARNCKLWRRLAGEANLRCADCAGRQQRVSIDMLNINGTTARPHADPTDLIGLLIPAIPMNDESGFYWEYAAIPAEARAWWEQLPLRVC
jgi:hypothetical protein